MKKKIVSAFLVLVMAVLLCMASASAAETGSLTVKYGGDTTTPATLTAYRVADATGTLTADFKDAKVNLQGNASVAVTALRDYMQDRYIPQDGVKIEGKTFKGNETVSGLEAGTYLVVEQTPAAGYNGASGRLVQVKEGEAKEVSVNPSRASGSLNVTYKAAGAELVAYRVADIEGYLAGPFASVKAKLANIAAGDTATLLGQIQLFQNFLNDPANAAVKDGGIAFTFDPNTKTATLTGLASGVYLVLETKAATGYYGANPILVALDIGKSITAEAKNSPQGGGGGTNVSVKKVWNDGDNPASRPVSITVELLKNNTPVQSVTLDASNNWSHWFGGLESGNYTVRETAISGYSASYTTSVQGNTTYFVITNTPSQTPRGTELQVEKKWSTGTPGATEIKVQLIEDGTGKVVQTATLNAGNNWEYFFKNLDGEKSYHVVEVAVSGYTATYTTTSGGFVITNTPSGGTKRDIPVRKTWSDNGNHPSSVTVQLKNQQDVVVATMVLNDSNNWSGTFLGLDPKQEYTVVELEPNGYYATYKNDNGTIQIINSTTPPTSPGSPPGIKIPQTGMTMWPVPVMMVGGIALVGSGAMLNRKRKDSGEQA